MRTAKRRSIEVNTAQVPLSTNATRLNAPTNAPPPFKYEPSDRHVAGAELQLQPQLLELMLAHERALLPLLVLLPHLGHRALVRHLVAAEGARVVQFELALLAILARLGRVERDQLGLKVGRVSTGRDGLFTKGGSVLCMQTGRSPTHSVALDALWLLRSGCGPVEIGRAHV